MNDNAHRNQDLLRQKVRIALFLFLVLMSLATCVLWLLHHQEERSRLDALMVREASTVALQKALILGNFKPIANDLLFFAQCSQMLDMLDSPGEHKADLIRGMSFFSRGSKIYDQVRVLDTLGKEIVRINFTQSGPVVVPDAQLQFKGDQYYFKNVFALNKGDIYISPFDLNIEHKEIEQPLKPTIRFGTPVFDRHDRKRGIIVFNYLGENLIRHVEDAAAGSPGNIMLLNAEGYWLISSDPGDEWGFMYEQKKELTMKNRYPGAWNVISSSDSGQFSNSGGLFTFATIHPRIEGWEPSSGSDQAFASNVNKKKVREYFWKIVLFIPKGQLTADAAFFYKRFFFIGFILAVLFAIGSWLTAKVRVADQEAKKALLRSRDELEMAVKERTLELNTVNKALQESETRFRQFFENAPEYCYMISMDGMILDVNKAALEILGYRKKDLIGRPVQMIYALESLPRMNAALETWKATGKLSDIEMDILAKSGEKRIVLLSADMVKDAAGNAQHSISVQKDITGRKRVEEEIKIVNEELLAINRIVMACSSTLYVKDILNSFMDEALQITGLEGGTICLVGPDDTLQLAAHRATSAATIADLSTNTVKVGDCLCGECARDRKPLILADREAVLKFSTRESTRGEDIRFHAAYPLIVKEKCLGVLCIFTRTDRKPPERSLKLLETVTAQIALAIENAQLHEDTLRHAATLEDKVRERTAEMETKIAEIERMNRLFVDRELRMIELKEKYKALEDKLNASRGGS